MFFPHKLNRYGLSLLILLSYSAYLQAQEKITIAVGEWPPYISQDEKHNGVVTHIITDIFSDIGIDASIKFLPWSRAYDDTKEGLHNASAIWMDKEERKVDFIYSHPVLIEQFVFFHHKALSFDWNSIKDLKAFTLGGIFASSYGPPLDKALSKGEITIERVNNPRQNFKKLLKKRLDLFPFELTVGTSVLNKHFSKDERQHIVHHPRPYLNNSSFVLFPKILTSSKELSERFNKQLKVIRDNGEYDTYFKNLKQGYYNQIDKAKSTF
jgi:polar amino acid transport system substrate-binding protein